jgi:hypothetical protein
MSCWSPFLVCFKNLFENNFTPSGFLAQLIRVPEIRALKLKNCLLAQASVCAMKRALKLRAKGCGLFIYIKSCRRSEDQTY